MKICEDRLCKTSRSPCRREPKKAFRKWVQSSVWTYNRIFNEASSLIRILLFVNTIVSFHIFCLITDPITSFVSGTSSSQQTRELFSLYIRSLYSQSAFCSCRRGSLKSRKVAGSLIMCFTQTKKYARSTSSTKTCVNCKAVLKDNYFDN